MALVVFPLALIDPSVFLTQNAVPCTLAFSISALEGASVSVLINSLPFELVLKKLALIETAYTELHLALALLETFIELAFIFVARGVD